MSRKAEGFRETKETAVKVVIELDGQGSYEISTGIPFFDHMLESFGRHGLFNLKIEAKGDLHVDAHHTVEDVGITLGEVFRDALGDKIGISRYGSILLPMEESLVWTACDISGRGQVVFNVKFHEFVVPMIKGEENVTFNVELIEEFFRAFCRTGGITLHINLAYGTNTHHIVEAIFKSAGKVLSQAVRQGDIDAGIPSTKGRL